MKNRKILFLAAILTALMVIFLLLTGSSLLVLALDKEKTIPLGTFITWAGMISLPLAIIAGIKEMRKPTRTFNSVLSVGIKLTLLLAILWVPIAYLLAGNISFSFTERASFQGGQQAMKLFWYLSYGIGIASISIVLLYWISLLFSKLVSRNKKAK